MTDLLEEFMGNVHSLHVKANGKIKKKYTVRIKKYSRPFFNKIILEEQKKRDLILTILFEIYLIRSVVTSRHRQERKTFPYFINLNTLIS